MKRKLDSYFKEKLNQPQQAPADAWENIQSRLPKKEKRPFVPFWTMVSGTVAVGLVLIGGIYTLNKPSNQPLPNFQTENSNSTVNHPQITNIHSNTIDETPKENKNTNVPSDGSIEQSNSQLTQVKHFNTYESNDIDFALNNYSIQKQSSDFQENKKTNATQKLENLLKIINNNTSTFDFNSFDNQLNNEKITVSLVNQFDTEVKIPSVDKQKKLNPKKKSNVDFNKFTISGFISPMALNTFVGKSMLSDEMSNYKTDNNITLAYGIKGSYALSEKIKLRTGVSKIGFEQFTRNVPLVGNVSTNSPTNTALTVKNINYNSQLRVINLSPHNLANGELYLSTYADMQQQSEYIEIPVEAEIALFQNESIGISATGGGSTWLLSKNKIYVHADEYTDELGRANNLNKASFSANAGLKFDMKISEDIQFNVEPHFKYLINTVNNIDKYNPYTVGVNAGISINLK